MTDTAVSALPLWPKIYPDTDASGWLKLHNEDFCVYEIPSMLPCDEGEHIWLEIEKNGANTGWVAKQLAEIAGVKEMDVGFAGLKDRHGITRQWFSIYLPLVRIDGDGPDFSQLQDRLENGEQVRILQQTRHSKKLRRGDLLGNRFEIRLRDIVGDKTALERNLDLIRQSGVPNYFGEQRFGHGGGNIESGRAMLSGEFKVRNRSKKSIYLSAVRSLIFNEVIAARISKGVLATPLTGDISAEQRLQDQAIATAPLWGRGRLQTTDDALALESEVAARYLELCDGMEHAGLNQERRAVIAAAENFAWQWLEADADKAAVNEDAYVGSSGQDLKLTFSLASGYYATSVLRELLTPLEKAPVYRKKPDTNSAEQQKAD